MTEKRKRLLRWGGIGVIVALVVGEIVARFILGLGTPPLSITHPKTEYMYKPNQDLWRFGNHFVVNAYGMRSRPFAEKKEEGEFRVMVFGDSVINGGNLTDQDDLATTILERKLREKKIGNVTVGNISAGSWGPGNWLAYAQEFGFFSADIIILVISSSDCADNPTFEPLDPNTHPTRGPVSALMEGIQRYLPRYLPKWGKSAAYGNPYAPLDEAQAKRGADDLKLFLELARKHTPKVFVLQYMERVEMQKKTPMPGYSRIGQVCEEVGITPNSLEPYLRRAMEKGIQPYRDHIHPNKAGQEILAEAMLEAIPKP